MQYSGLKVSQSVVQVGWNQWTNAKDSLIRKNWSSSPFGWQNILDIRIFGWKGVKFKKQQYFEKFAKFRFKNLSECGTSGLEWF